jgi:hypothetical protein
MACGSTTQRGHFHSSAGALNFIDHVTFAPQQEEAEPVCRALSQAPNWLDLEDGTNTHVWFAREHLRMQLWEDRTKQDVWLRVSGYMSEAKRCGPNGTDMEESD